MQSCEFYEKVIIPSTLIEAIALFMNPDFGEDFCLRLAVQRRWKDGICCPHCGCLESASFIRTRRIWNCLTCKKQFSVKTGTIFGESPLPLSKWFIALWMLVNCKNGVSSYEIAGTIGVTQKTAWFMLHRLREAISSGSLEKSVMSGEVEADETYVGGRAKNMHLSQKEKRPTGRGSVGKAIVFGLLERSNGGAASRAYVNTLPDTKAETLESEVRSHVLEGSAMMTDAHSGYRGLKNGYEHNYVDHAVRYVEERVTSGGMRLVHTNGLENLWSLTKRALKGTYVSVEPEHLKRYLSEQTFRFNERKLRDSERFILGLSRFRVDRLDYCSLTSHSSALRDDMGFVLPLRGGPRAD